MLYYFFLIAFIFQSFVFAQPQHFSVEFKSNSTDVLKHALSGGLTNPQYSAIDLDGDNIKDLVYFDRQGGVVVPFINQGSPNTTDYQFAPEYRYRFPRLQNWMLLRDYNCDQITDLFAYKYDTQTGKVSVTVYKASRDAQQKILFSPAINIIEYRLKGGNDYYNLFNSTVDLPAVDDIDGDGDIDILNFNNSGGYIEMFKNTSVEEGYGCDSLHYIFNDNCWGRIYESGVSEFIDLSPHIDSCPRYPNWTPVKSGPRHAGSTLLTIDMDNDGDKELFLGDLSFKNVNKLYNNGNADTAHLSTQEIFFPQNSVNVNIDIFPAAFHLDVNNDGRRDFLAAPNIEGSAEDDQTWYYQNTGTDAFPLFNYQQNNFLVEDMIDLGKGCFPALVDFNADGLKDIVLGNNKQFINPFLAQSYLQLYQNVGTATVPVYQLVDTDFANVQQYNQKRLVPSFGDLDGDGDQDLIIGLENGQLFYLLNSGSAIAPNYTNLVANYAGIDVGSHASPQLVDVDRDGDLDLLIGERNGNTNYFENTGTLTAAVFSATADTETFGFVDAKLPGTIEGNSAPQLIDINGNYHFFVGNEQGQVWQYHQVDSNLFGAFQPLVSVLDSIDVGEESVLAIGQLNNDEALEILVGNKRGGLEMYSASPIVSTQSIQQASFDVRVGPNPCQDFIQYSLQNPPQEAHYWELHDLLGRKLWSSSVQTQSQGYLDIRAFAAGTYVLSLHLKNQMNSFKIIKL